MTHRRVRTILTGITVAAVVIAAAFVAWRLFSARRVLLPAPAETVQRALELRRSRSKDASAYAELFADANIASTLASDSAAATRSPIPDWDRPYVSAESSGGADVVVVWRDTRGYADWPYANVFRLQDAGGKWRIVDASAVASAGAVPTGSR